MSGGAGSSALDAMGHGGVVVVHHAVVSGNGVASRIVRVGLLVRWWFGHGHGFEGILHGGGRGGWGNELGKVGEGVVSVWSTGSRGSADS